MEAEMNELEKKIHGNAPIQKGSDLSFERAASPLA
jgi:hypothetical protein